MGSSSIPCRPRLAEHVLPRRHVIDEHERIILHDERQHTVFQLGPREWGVLQAADGTRDLAGIVVAARRLGSWARVEAVRDLLLDLAARGLLVAGEPAQPNPSSKPPLDPSPSTPERVGDVGALRKDRPLVVLPDGGLRCNGAGTCCRLYGTVMMSVAEAQQVRSLLPTWRVGRVSPERWTTPVRGSEPGPLVAMIARDGACGFLQDDGLCAIHHHGGVSAKPWGCRAFPRVYVDDGVSVHVSLKAECPCVLAPHDGDREPLVQPGWTHASSLPDSVVVDVLPASVEDYPAGRRWRRSVVREWIETLASRPAPVDPAATAWMIAARIEATRLPEPSDEIWRAAPPPSGAVAPWVDALHHHVAAKAREHASWRSPNDLVRRVSTAMAILTRIMGDRDALAEVMSTPPEYVEQEARYWTLGLHDYRWVRRGSLVTSLRDEAVRIWIARALPAVLYAPEPDPDLRAPLALVEALFRAHGVGAYVNELE